MPHEMKVHGSYPLDSGCWELVKKITRDEAADLVNAPLELREMKDAYGKAPKYLWVNKGFIVLGLAQDKAMPSIKLALIEQFFDVRPKDLPIGAQAVTLYDGQYLLIEFTGDTPRSFR